MTLREIGKLLEIDFSNVQRQLEVIHKKIRNILNYF